MDGDVKERSLRPWGVTANQSRQKDPQWYKAASSVDV